MIALKKLKPNREYKLVLTSKEGGRWMEFGRFVALAGDGTACFRSNFDRKRVVFVPPEQIVEEVKE